MTDEQQTARQQAAEERRNSKIAANQVVRPECTMPEYSALYAYQRGCRCKECVNARRAASRKCQAAAYGKDPEKFKARQRAYVARRRAASNG